MPKHTPQVQDAEAHRFSSFRAFYPYYLSEHRSVISRRLHAIGTATVIGLLAYAAVAAQPMMLLAVPVAGYGFAWIGHFFFEGNRPATFRHPFYSLLGDFVMFRDILLGRLPR